MCPPSMAQPRAHPRLSCMHPYSVLTIFILASRVHTFIELCFLHACIDMDPSEIVYLSSDEESPFDRNQCLLKKLKMTQRLNYNSKNSFKTVLEIHKTRKDCQNQACKDRISVNSLQDTVCDVQAGR